MIGGVEGLAEREWEGRTIRIGTVLVELVQLRPRCVMTTFDPDTLDQDHGVLRRIVRESAGRWRSTRPSWSRAGSAWATPSHCWTDVDALALANSFRDHHGRVADALDPALGLHGLRETVRGLFAAAATGGSRRRSRSPS